MCTIPDFAGVDLFISSGTELQATREVVVQLKGVLTRA